MSSILWLATLGPLSAFAFEVNGRHWDTLPIPVHVDTSQLPPEIAPEDALAWVQAAAKAWETVACSDVSFAVEAAPGGGWAADGKNSVFWVSADWMFSAEAAGATLWIPTAPGAPMEVDLALNAEAFAWIAGGGDALATGIVDPVSVLAHELGHWLGLSHTPYVHATMFQAMLPNGVQATLDADDKLGACALYPAATANTWTECTTDADCAPAGRCAWKAPYSVCGEKHAQIGDSCSKTDLDCQELCVLSLYECSTLCAFTTLDYTAGYCAPLCSPEAAGTAGEPACPATWVCTALEALDGAVCLAPESEDRPEPPDPSTPSLSDTMRNVASTRGARCVESEGLPPAAHFSSTTTEPAPTTDASSLPADGVADAKPSTPEGGSTVGETGPTTSLDGAPPRSDGGCQTPRGVGHGATMLLVVGMLASCARSAAARGRWQRPRQTLRPTRRPYTTI